MAASTCVLAEVDDRVAVGGLVGRRDQRVQGERVLLGRGELLLHQAPEHSSRFGGKGHARTVVRRPRADPWECGDRRRVGYRGAGGTRTVGDR